MMKIKKIKSTEKMARFVVAMTVSLSITSCSNPLSGLADKTSDEALYYSIQINLNESDFAGAIEDCTALSADYLALDDVKFMCASAYAGRAGFQTLSMLSRLEAYEAQAPTKLLLDYFISVLTATTQADITDCDSAETLIRSIGAASARTDDQNAFMALLMLYKMGLIANVEADSTTDDGAIDGAFTDACTDVSAANAQSMRTAMWELNNTLSAMTSTVYTALSTAVSTVCTALAAVNGGINAVCAGATLPATSVNLEDGARMLIHEGVLMGLDTCAGGPSSFANCICP